MKLITSYFAVTGCLLAVAVCCAPPVEARQAEGKPAMPQNPLSSPLSLPPSTLPAAYNPLPNLPPIALDEANNNVGIAQQMARAKHLQGRVLWIDGTANMNAINSVDKIAGLAQQIKKAGFNTVVLDVKPIVGFTLYPSKYAPKLTTWKDRTIPTDFDPLPDMVSKCHQSGLQLIVNMNVWSEGHRGDNNTVKQQGPAYEHPEWQTVLYTVEGRLHSAAGVNNNETIPVLQKVNQAEIGANEIGVYTDVKALPSHDDGFAIAVAETGKVIAHIEGNAVSLLGSSPWKGSYLVGRGTGAAFLRRNAPIGSTLTLETVPVFVPMAQMQEQVPLMVNPHRADVQKRILDMVTEVCSRYEIDGVIFDDRFRYAGINADFSEDTHKQFVAYLAPILGGKSLKWPDDVFRYDLAFPTLARRLTPGPYYDAWLTWRALTLRNWLASAVATVKAIRPNATVSTYNGSWYGDYAALGANWAADDFNAGFRFLTPGYQKTGYAGLTDWITTGCYYPIPTMSEALASGKSAGATIEAAGQLSNRAANDQTWVYAGLNVADYTKQPDKLKQAVQAALASTQGVMVFDLSAFDDTIWNLFGEIFKEPAIAPHAVPGLLAQVRQQRLARKATGVPDPPVIIYNGIPGTGL